ncbi:MAG: heme biosynthesis HemY N-terminal domain-containing protein [Pseudomonadota bacterium]
MIGSIVKIALFICVVAAVMIGVNFLMESPGGITINFAGQELYFSPLGFAAALLVLFFGLWLLFKLVGLLIAVLRFIVGDETALSRYFDRSRERRGLEALSRGMTALASGDAKLARSKAEKAERLLKKPELTRVFSAQAAELSGDATKAKTYYRALAEDPNTAFVGVKGLLSQAMASGETDKALKLAEAAFKLRPREPEVLETLYSLQSQKFDWEGARHTLGEQRRAKLLPPADANRRDAMLALAQAEDAEAAGNKEQARKLSVEAAKLDTSNPETVATAARHLVAAGSARAATKLIVDAWRSSPSPQLAAAYAAIEPDETSAERRVRFEKLFEAFGTHPEALYTRAELALMTEDWRAARQSLERLEDGNQSARYCAIMAAVARGEGAPEAEVRGWLARAISAPRGEGEGEVSQAAMLPLLVGEGDDRSGPSMGQRGADAMADDAKGATGAAAGQPHPAT